MCVCTGGHTNEGSTGERECEPVQYERGAEGGKACIARVAEGNKRAVRGPVRECIFVELQRDGDEE